MKRSIKIICAFLLALCLCTAGLAGDIPEALLSTDEAMVFIGTVDEFTVENSEVKTAKVTPSVKIKGEVEVGKSREYTHCDFGGVIPEKGKEYLFGYINEINFYIYEIEQRSQEKIKLKNSDKFDMVERLEDYLNDGVFAMAEKERAGLGKSVSLKDFIQEETFSENPAVKAHLRKGDAVAEVSLQEFLDVAENIYITNIKNTSIQHTAQEYESVIYIELRDAEDKTVSFAAVSDNGEVDRYAMFMSRLMCSDYSMGSDDVKKLNAMLGAGGNSNKTPALLAVAIAVIAMAAAVVVIKRKR